jgi:MoaA/NifB/PqqE/SkfB family radical SAM enzyme
MSNLIRIDSNQPPDLLRIELFLGDKCNYNCWYCFPGSNEGIQPWPKLDSIIDNLSHLIEYYKKTLNKKEILLHIVGGEPTLWRDFGEFTKHFKDKYNAVISMSSNGSRTLRWWEEYGHYFDHVMLSCHHETIDTKHMVAVADLLYDKNVWCNCIVLMDPNHWDKCLNIIEELKLSKNQYSIATNEILHSTVNYTSEQRNYLSTTNKRLPDARYYYECKKTINEDPTLYFSDGAVITVNNNYLSLNNYSNFKGWDCNLGVDTLYINKDGSVSGACKERLYNLDYKFNIYDKDFKEQFNPVITSTTCYQTNCHCAPEQRATKVFPIVKL